jgi:23S rRNA-/tRNA-specific pseudouridylate synthase
MYGDFLTEIGHHLLHCRKCTLTHPVTGEEMVFEAPMWQDFEETLASARNNS